MNSYKHIDTSPRFLAVDLDGQWHKGGEHEAMKTKKGTLQVKNGGLLPIQQSQRKL